MARLLNLTTYTEARGNLTVIEENILFVTKQIYKTKSSS